MHGERNGYRFRRSLRSAGWCVNHARFFLPHNAITLERDNAAIEARDMRSGMIAVVTVVKDRLRIGRLAHVTRNLDRLLVTSAAKDGRHILRGAARRGA